MTPIRLKPNTMLLLLAVALVALAAAFALLSCPFDTNGYLLNLSAELLGAVVTVVVIDTIMSARERARWRPVTDRLPRRVRDGAARAIRCILGALVINVTPVEARDGNEQAARQRMRSTVSRRIHDAVPRLAPADWPAVYEAIDRAGAGISTLVGLHGQHLSVDATSILSNAETHLADAAAMIAENRTLIYSQSAANDRERSGDHDALLFRIAQSLESAVLELSRISSGETQIVGAA